MTALFYGLRHVTRWKFVCIFADGKNYSSHQFLNWWQQQSTGLLHLDGSNLLSGHQIKKDHTLLGVVFFYW